MKIKLYGVILLSIFLLCGCIWGKSLYKSKQLSEKYFVCKGKRGGRWLEPEAKVFTKEDKTLIAVALLDPSREVSFLSFELVNPEQEIIATEKKEYKRSQEMGMAFDVQRLYRSGDPGIWTVNFFVDGIMTHTVHFELKGDKEEELLAVPEPESTDLEKEIAEEQIIESATSTRVIPTEEATIPEATTVVDTTAEIVLPNPEKVEGEIEAATSFQQIKNKPLSLEEKEPIPTPTAIEIILDAPKSTAINNLAKPMSTTPKITPISQASPTVKPTSIEKQLPKPVVEKEPLKEPKKMATKIPENKEEINKPKINPATEEEPIKNAIEQEKIVSEKPLKVEGKTIETATTEVQSSTK